MRIFLYLSELNALFFLKLTKKSYAVHILGTRVEH